MPASFTQHITVAPQHLDGNNHINNLVYLQMMLDIAGAHWQDVVPPDFPEHHVWLIRRHEIDYLAQGYLGDELEITTWVGQYTNVTWERHATITRREDGKILAKGISTWMLVDMQRQRPIRLDAGILGIFG